jgi:phosphoribosylformylglycinamidine synthase
VKKPNCEKGSIVKKPNCEKSLIVRKAHMTQTYQARIYVTLRPSVLDPAGTAVQSGLEQLGYGGVDQVRIGKLIELQLAAPDKAQAQTQLDQMCDELLANPVIENYRFELEQVTP